MAFLLFGQRGIFDVEDRYKRFGDIDDPLDKFRGWETGYFSANPGRKRSGRSNRANGGRPPVGAEMMLKILMLQVLYNLSEDQREFQLSDRLSFMRCLGLSPADKMPDAKTIWLYRDQLVEAGAINKLFDRFDKHLVKAS